MEYIKKNHEVRLEKLKEADLMVLKEMDKIMEERMFRLKELYENNKKKNVIWIIGDQLRAQALGCNGDPNVQTPNIDNLAAMGINFTQAVSGYPLCCPFRGSMLTSKYPHKCVKGHQYRMPPEQPTIASVFNDEGYKTAYFGKWHVDGYKEEEGRAAFHIVPPERRGDFQYWMGYENNNSQWDCWVHGGDGINERQYKLPGFETDELTNLFIDYINKRGEEKKEGNEQPFFAVLSVQPPHEPYVAPEEFMQNFSPSGIKLRENVPNVKRITETVRKELAGYYAMIENFDKNIGKIRKALSEADLSMDTHIIFFSDHGDLHGSHGRMRKIYPYEESIRIPFIIGGEIPAYHGRKRGVSNALVNHVDIAPTTLGLCGIDVPDWMDGYDYSHYRLSKKKDGNEPNSAYLQNVTPIGDELDFFKNGLITWRGIVTKDGWKYACFKGVEWCVYNLNEDPYEQVNLAFDSNFIEKRRALRNELKEWIEKTEDSFLLPEYQD